MLKTATKKWKSSRGATAVELLMVVALLAVLLLLAVPNLFQSMKRLKIAELDGTAREIFLVAQNDFTDMKASDRLAQFDVQTLKKENAAGGVQYYAGAEEIPAVFGARSAVVSLLETLPGQCVVYLNPSTGDITDVYYAKPNLAAQAVQQLRAELAGKDNPSLRAEKAIGYYGGLALSSRSGEEPAPVPHEEETLALINGEDLYLQLVYPALGQAFANPERVRAEITLADEHGNTRRIAADGKAALATGNTATDQALQSTVISSVNTRNDYGLFLLLDSMVDGLSFSQLYPELVAGDDLKVTASLSYGGKWVYQNAPVGTENSLFAAKNKENTAKGGTLRRQGIEFARVRHLSNLRYWNRKIHTGAAVQTRDIDFDLAARRETMFPLAAHRERAPVSFSPVYLGEKIDGAIIDGKDSGGKTHLLRGFRISGAAAGIFGDVAAKVTMQNLQLVNSQVQGSYHTGSLIGTVRSARGAVMIEGCGVYQQLALGRGGVTGSGAAGTAAPTGGLVGAVYAPENRVTIRSSFAAVPVESGANCTGGLVGEASGNVLIENSYASGAVTAPGTTAVGGLVGAAAGSVQVQNSFSTSAVTGAASCGGLIGAAAGNTAVRGSYACGIVAVPGAKTYGPLLGKGAAVYENTVYLSQSGGPKGVTDAYGGTMPAGVTAMEYDALAKGVQNPAAQCFPYDAALRGKAYPFRMVTQAYYGDWPVRIEPAKPISGSAYGLSYFEEYDDGSWGFYSFDQDGKLMDSLDYQNKKTIKSAGYCVAVAAGTTNVKPPNYHQWNEAPLDNKTNIPDRNIDLYPLRDGGSRLVTHINQTNSYVYDAQANRHIYANPHFGAALSLTSFLASEANPMYIRTEDHLLTRKQITDAWYFKQTHDIIVAKADTGGIDNNTGSVYDGGGNAIYNLKTPLFSINKATIKNLTLIGAQMSASPLVGTNNTGALISGCHVQDSTLLSQNGNAIGFADLNDGTIEGSSVRAQITSATGSAAGFVRENSWNGTIRNCTVSGTVTANGAGDAAAMLLTNNGKIENSTAAAMAVRAPNGSASGFVMLNNWGKTIYGSTPSGNVSGKNVYPFVRENHGTVSP